jgi:hypothetical protein
MAGRRYVRDNKGRFASTGATARGGRLRTEAGNKRATRTMQAEGGPRGTIGKPKGLKPGAIKPATAKPVASARASKVNLSQSAFQRRAEMTEKRARVAERNAAGLDRSNPANRRSLNAASSLRSAADSYASYARRGKSNPDFSAADLFKGRSRQSTAPKLSASEKAAATRRANAAKRFESNARKMEQARRSGR